jgi:hypothetical protein
VFVKAVERDLARRLRREQGLPIKAIGAAIGVSSTALGVLFQADADGFYESEKRILAVS